MSFVPSFNLDATNLDITNDADLQEAIDKEANKKSFEPGRYSLKIVKARYHANKDTKEVTCAKDPTWFNAAVTLEAADGRTKDYFIQVPTTKVKYGDKGTLFVWTKFCEFMAAIGEAVSLTSLTKVVPKYFGSEDALKKLVGKELEIDMAYEGAYAQKTEDELFKIVLKSGDYQEDGETIKFPDIASAKVFAESKQLKLTFCEIKKLHSKVKAVAKQEGWSDTVAVSTTTNPSQVVPETVKKLKKSKAAAPKAEGWE